MQLIDPQLVVLTGTAIWRITGGRLVAASSLAFLVAVTFNYAAQRSWSSKARPRTALRLGDTSGGLAINAAVVHVGSEMLAWYYILVQLLAMSAVILWKFVLFSIWAFPA